jgi:hypothetical protein
MRNILFLSLVVLSSFNGILIYGQEKCKVLKPEIAGTYDGKCKKGLANGKGTAIGTDRYEGQFLDGLPSGYGTYTWANGDIYTGEWSEGMRHGIGKMSLKIDGVDSIRNGLWQKDVYKGPKPRNPYVSYKEGVDRYTLQKNNTTKNRVLVDIFQNGNRNTSITNFMMSTSSGSDTQVGLSVGYDFIIFPVTIKIMYTTLNKFHTMPQSVRFEFEIFEPGDWKLVLEN